MASGTNWHEEYLNEEGKFENGNPEKEAVFFGQIAKQIRDVVLHYKEDNNNTARRANHAQIIAGFTNTRFSVLPSPELPEDLAVGFLMPGKDYSAIIRFSNASGEIVDDDSKPDLRGLALRIQTDDGNQDFLMTNAELHHAKDAREAMITIRAGVEKNIIADAIPDFLPLEDTISGLAGALPFLIKHLGLKTGWQIAQTLKKQMKRKVESLSTETFWSRAPIAIGREIKPESSIAVKYRLRPVTTKSEQHEISHGEKNLRKKLEDELNTNDIKYIFEVQRFLDPINTPIEDSTKSWGDDSSFQAIAELIIPRNSKNERDFVDSLIFNPWNIDTSHFKPLGSMNRSRKIVYAASVEARSEK